MCQKPPLFAGHNCLQDHIRKSTNAMRAEIDGMTDEELLNVNILERARQLAEKYRMRSVTLGDPVIADHGQKRLEARGVVSFAVYAIPFEGDPELFRRRVNWLNKMPPVGELWEAERELRVEVNSLVGGAKEMKATFERTKKEIEEHVKAVTEQVESHNRWLEGGARDQMLARRTKVRNHVKLVEELGMPIRPSAATAATVPVTLQRKGSAVRPTSSARPAVAPGGKAVARPEPTLAMDVYEHILEVIQVAGMSMERGPQSFEGMNEGQLRDQVLMVLNSHYQGKAMAEAFNKQGHTDILVPHEGHQLFIGECKIWQGAGDVRQAIEQLMRYTTWRETKTAILFFTRSRNVSAILKRIPEVFREHHSFVRQEMDYARQGALRFVMRHGSDADGRMIVTVMVFQVVGKEKKAVEVVEEERFWD